MDTTESYYITYNKQQNEFIFTIARNLFYNNFVLLLRLNTNGLFHFIITQMKLYLIYSII